MTAVGSTAARLSGTWQRVRTQWSPDAPWIVVAIWTVVFGALVAVAVLPRDWGVDGQHDLDVARSFAGGGPIYDGWYFYSPLATVLTVPATLGPVTLALISWAAAKALLVVACVSWLTPTLSRTQKFVATAAALTFIGTLHDVALGNTNVPITVALAIATLGRNHWTRGVPLGIVLAIVPKPFAIPVLFWLLVHRRQPLLAAVVAALALTSLGLIVAGPGRYFEWLLGLTAGTKYLGSFSGNVGLSAASPVLFALVAAVASIVTVGATLRAEPVVGLIVSLAGGVLISPYIGAYSAVPLLLALLILASRAPRAAFVLAATAQIATFLALPLWTAATLIAALFMRRSSRIVPARSE